MNFKFLEKMTANKIKQKLSLSKSQYTKGLQCKKALWLKKYNPEVLTAPDDIKKSDI